MCPPYRCRQAITIQTPWHWEKNDDGLPVLVEGQAPDEGETTFHKLPDGRLEAAGVTHDLESAPSQLTQRQWDAIRHAAATVGRAMLPNGDRIDHPDIKALWEQFNQPSTSPAGNFDRRALRG